MTRQGEPMPDHRHRSHDASTRFAAVSLAGIILLAGCAGKTPSLVPEPMALAMTGAEIAATVEDVFEDPEEDAKTGTVLEALADVGEWFAWPFRALFVSGVALVTYPALFAWDAAWDIPWDVEKPRIQALNRWFLEWAAPRFRLPGGQSLNDAIGKDWVQAVNHPKATSLEPWDRPRGGHLGACWSNQCP